jgi:hypothetical protein
MPALQYQKLDADTESVRLLRVFPGDASDVIRCELEHADLTDRPTFVALSYAWSLESGHGYIERDGMPMQVGKNLLDFLYRFRAHAAGVDTLLWVDAICAHRSVHTRNAQPANFFI